MNRDRRTGVKWTRCGPTGKRSYRSDLDALSVAAWASATGDQRFYRCRHCHGFHLTRQPLREDI